MFRCNFPAVVSPEGTSQFPELQLLPVTPRTLLASLRSQGLHTRWFWSCPDLIQCAQLAAEQEQLHRSLLPCVQPGLIPRSHLGLLCPAFHSCPHHLPTAHRSSLALAYSSPLWKPLCLPQSPGQDHPPSPTSQLLEPLPLLPEVYLSHPQDWERRQDPLGLTAASPVRLGVRKFAE